MKQPSEMEGWRRRISLNPALFVEQERKSRSQSLATFKLSYYPKDADRKCQQINY